MSSGRITASGNADKKFKDIAAGTECSFSGNSDVTISGNIGSGASIKISGNSDVKIKGTVAENVIFNVSGNAELTFSKRPCQSVIDQISQNGNSSVNMPGGFTAKKGKKSSGSSVTISNGGVIVSSGGSVVFGNGGIRIGGVSIGNIVSGGNISVINGDVSIDDDSDQSNDSDDDVDMDRYERKESKNNSSHSAIYNRIAQQPVARREPAVVEQKLSPEETFLKDCSKYTKQYIESFKGKKTHTSIVEEMKLTQAELDQLEAAGCIDSITFEIINRPVEVNEQVYDLNTVLTFNGKDPKRVEFEARDVIASRKTVTAFEEAIKKMMEARKLEAAKKNSNENVGAPGGPSF